MRFGVLCLVGLALGCASATLPVEHPAPSPDDTADPEPGFRYAWSLRRGEHERYTGGPYYKSPCNPNRDNESPSSELRFLSPKNPTDMAALVLDRRGAGDGTMLVLDRGVTDGVDSTWSAALLDDLGRPLHDWVCVVTDGRRLTTFVAPIPLAKAAPYSHVALFQDPPQLYRR